MPDEKTETERVTMVWPADLKEKVREKVGQRGLTKFVVTAVERHLDYVYVIHDKEEPQSEAAPEPEPESEPEPTPAPAPEVAPSPAPEPVVTESVTEVSEDSTDDDFDEHAPMFTQAKKSGPPPSATMTPDAKANLFEKLQQDGKEMGIDLKPASEVLAPYPKGTPATPEGMESCPFHPEMALRPGAECYKCTLENNGTDTTPTPAPQPLAVTPVPQTCGTCGSVLENGECWNCF